VFATLNEDLVAVVAATNNTPFEWVRGAAWRHDAVCSITYTLARGDAALATRGPRGRIVWNHEQAGCAAAAAGAAASSALRRAAGVTSTNPIDIFASWTFLGSVLQCDWEESSRRSICRRHVS
jgi:hypothetical protein